jgi:hypothetical protein
MELEQIEPFLHLAVHPAPAERLAQDEAEPHTRTGSPALKASTT